ncbi:Kinesin-13A [Hibiscus syriacus]|uniref:Kinesin-13A n=1 Tax=Hibiscus syriacus TaxID=106335 RepID=A0A6A3AKB6_HIBSY|nr:Kinesin-13A [Hibiscus syriacus]
MKLCMREDGKQQVCIVGLQEFEVSDVQIVKEYIERGNAARSTGSTGANEESSRTMMGMNQNQGRLWERSLLLILLAAKEVQIPLTTIAKQELVLILARIEGAEINKSLLVLKECIRALDNDQIHIPFRGSKLTAVLRDSFIGNSRTVMISCISPNAGYYSPMNRVKSLSRTGNPKKDQAVNSLQPSNKDASSASSLLPTADVDDVYERKQEVKVVDTGRRIVEKDVYTADYDKQPSTFLSSYPFNGREECGKASGPTDRERFELVQKRVPKVSPPRRKATREEKPEKMRNMAKKDGGSDLSTSNSRQANAVNNCETNNVGYRQYDPEPPADENINAVLEEEEALIAAHRKEWRTQWRLFVRQEMKLLAEVDQQGSHIDNCVTQLSIVLSRKTAGLVSLQDRLARFQHRLKEQEILSQKRVPR